MSLPIRIAALALLACLPASTAVRAEDVLLRLSPTKEPLIFRTTTVLKQAQTVAGVEFDTELTTTTLAVWTFLHVDQDGHLHWQCHNQRLQVRGKVGFLGEFAFDSNDADRRTGSQLDAALAPVYAALSDATFEVTFDPRGKVVDVTGFDGFITPLAKDDLFALQYTFGGDDTGAGLLYQEQRVVFSEQPVQPGTLWSVRYDRELPSLGKLSGTKSFTLRRRAQESGRRLAEIDIAYALSVDSDMKASGIHATGLLTTRESKGTAKVDAETGQMISLNSTVTISGTVSLELGGQQYAVPTEQTWSVAVERLKEVPDGKQD